ncbi:hypothetical protein ES708_15276 [subsurface metagenome]
MRSLTIIILLVAMVFLVLAFGVNQYKVYDQPALEDNGELSSFTMMRESQLLEETAYDGIITDAKGNLINKGREAGCLT